MSNMPAKVICAVFILLFANPVPAAVRRLSLVSYESYGWSSGVVAELTFVRGQELNQATHSYKFEHYANYVLIWFDNDETGEGR